MSFDEVLDLLLKLWPLLLLQLGLMVWALVDVLRRRSTRTLSLAVLDNYHSLCQLFWPHRLLSLRESGAVNAIEIRDLSKSFRGHWALQEVSLEVPRGAVYGFLGPNGAGKTTAIKILMGLLNPSGGRAALLGRRSAPGYPAG